MESTKKKVVIIGSGISGMSSGVYLAANGFDVTIYEKHSISGGQCTCWVRDGVLIDGCAHWIVGTNPNSQLFHLWKYIGAFDENSKIYETDYFKKFDIDGEIVTFYSDLKLLKQELLRVSPKDKKYINEFIRGVRAYQSTQIPDKKPMDMMNILDYMRLGIDMLPMVPAYLKYTKITIEQFTDRFHSEVLKKVFRRTISMKYNIHSLMYTMGALSLMNAGVVEGGSLQMAQRIQKRFQSLGGKCVFNAGVKRVLIENNTAVGIELENGEEIKADYVVSSADAYFTFNKLLEGKYKKDYYEERFGDRTENPLTQNSLIAFKVNKPNIDLPKMMCIEVEPFEYAGTKVEVISIRSHAFDPTQVKNGASTITVLLKANDSVYDEYKNMPREEYLKEKERVGQLVGDRIRKYYNLTEDELKFIDMTTPLTYERYTNAYRGSYMAFVATHNKKLMDNGVIPGLNNFFLTGQWLMSPGGLPVALFTGKHTAYRITKQEKKKFIHE